MYRGQRRAMVWVTSRAIYQLLHPSCLRSAQVDASVASHALSNSLELRLGTQWEDPRLIVNDRRSCVGDHEELELCGWRYAHPMCSHFAPSDRAYVHFDFISARSRRLCLDFSSLASHRLGLSRDLRQRAHGSGVACLLGSSGHIQSQLRSHRQTSLS